MDMGISNREYKKYGLTICLNAHKLLTEYMTTLIDLAEQKQFEKRYGVDKTKELILEGIATKMQWIAEEELGKINALRQAEKILGIP